MNILSAIYTNEDNTSVNVTTDTGKTMSVPTDSDNRHYVMLLEWVGEGNTIDPYVPPPVPTDADLAEGSVRGNKGLLGMARHFSGNDALTEDDLVTIVRGKM